MSWEARLTELVRPRNGVAPWLVSVAVFSASLAVRLLLEPWLVSLKFLTFYPAIVVATLINGWLHGLFVVALAVVSAWYFFFEPVNSFAIKDANAVAGLIGFILVGAFLVVLVGALRELIRRLETSRAELEAAKLVQEDLFRELQHRVANNLQLAVTMLQNAKRTLSKNPTAANDAMTAAQDRIWALAQLNRRLYDGAAAREGLASILEEALSDTFGQTPVRVVVDVAETELSLPHMTAMVLLVSEAATNALKHAFCDGKGALFEVKLSKLHDGRLQLQIRDDGPGIDPATALDPRKGSLGMGIMQAFARQLGGTLKVSGPPGTTLTVEF
jgi:two-component sensor histidine kinase